MPVKPAARAKAAEVPERTWLSGPTWANTLTPLSEARNRAQSDAVGRVVTPLVPGPPNAVDGHAGVPGVEKGRHRGAGRGPGDGHAVDGPGQAQVSGRPEEGGVAEGEDAAVRGHQPVAAAGGG